MLEKVDDSTAGAEKIQDSYEKFCGYRLNDI